MDPNFVVVFFYELLLGFRLFYTALRVEKVCGLISSLSPKTHLPAEVRRCGEATNYYYTWIGAT